MLGVVGIQREHEQTQTRAKQRRARPVDRRAGRGMSLRAAPAAKDQPGRTHRRQRQVQPEDKPPAARAGGGGRHRGAVDRADHAARFLQRGDRPEGKGAHAVAVEVGCKRQAERDQAAASEALDESTSDHPRQTREVPRSGCRRYRGAGREGGHARGVHRDPAANVRIRAEQRHRDHVAGEEPGHDWRRRLEMLDREADVS